MTAEIAIINRTAVTLAADSAVTLRVANARKIYNTADKLFELSVHDPLGIMIFNNLEFQGIPYEVVIKQFRGSTHCRNAETVFDAASCFLNYLANEIPVPDAVRQQHIYNIAREIFSEIRKRFERTLPQKLAKALTSDQIYEHFLSLLSAATRKLSSLPAADCFKDIQPDDVVAAHSDAIERAIGDAFAELPLSEEDRVRLRSIAGLFLHREAYSGMFSGFVIAGFGSRELFPSLQAFDCDGLIAGKLKVRETKKIDIDRAGPLADIVPFAQQEMVDRFLSGIDPEVGADVQKFVEAATFKLGTNLLDAVPKLSKRTRKSLESALRAGAHEAGAHFRTDALKAIQDKFKTQVQNMVLMMPKQELANLAEHLINITSMKRRVSAEEESVGGPIDLAVITRSEGFVWVKRKHYFDPELNPRFFRRHYRPQTDPKWEDADEKNQN